MEFMFSQIFKLLQLFSLFQQGNTMYAEMPANLISKQRSSLEVGKVYNIKHFRVVHAKSSYKVTSAPFMIYFTLYSIIEVCKKPESAFLYYL
jgi:hypothetical protein